MAECVSNRGLNNLVKADDVLFELKMAFVAFLKSFFPFEYENKIYHLENNYVASPWTRCDVCGNYPIQDVSVIRSNDGQEMRVGNKCIDLITNRKVSEWFRDFKSKRDNITMNRRYIDGLASILATYREKKPAGHLLENDMERLQKALERMCNGFILSKEEEQLTECYINMSNLV